MGATAQDVTAYAGDTVVMEFYVTDDDGQPMDVSTGTFIYALRSPTPVTKATADMDLTGAANGKVIVTLTAANTDPVPPGAYPHALQMTLGGETQHVAVGRFRMLAEIAD